MKTMWDGFISQRFSAWGKVRSMRELYLYVCPFVDIPKIFVNINVHLVLYMLYSRLYKLYIVWTVTGNDDKHYEDVLCVWSH